MPKSDEEIRFSLQNIIKEFSGIESPEEMMKKADWLDLAAGVHYLDLTTQIMGELLNRKAPEPEVRSVIKDVPGELFVFLVLFGRRNVETDILIIVGLINNQQQPLVLVLVL